MPSSCMYNFKRFDTTYSVKIFREDTETISSCFDCRMEVSIVRTLAGNYDFISKKRSEVLINGCPVKNRADLIMLKLGDTLFPLNMRKSSENFKLRVENKNQIVERWDKCSQSYLSKDNADTVVQYIHMSRNSITNEACLLKSILRNSTIQIITLIGHEKFEFKSYNLRHLGDIYNFTTDDIVIKLTKNEVFCTIKNHEIDASYLLFRGALIHFEGTFTLNVGNEHYKQYIHIKSNAENQRIIK